MGARLIVVLLKESLGDGTEIVRIIVLELQDRVCLIYGLVQVHMLL